jgi:hypothetical protein
MMPLRIAYNDQAKLQTVSASSEVAQYPALNAVHPHLSRVWRTTAVAAQWIKFDAGVGKTIAFDTACIVGHNLTSTAVVRVQTDDADTWAPPGGVDKSGDPTQSIIFVDLAPLPTARRYCRVYVDDPANPAGYIQIGRVFLCVRFEGETIDRGFRFSIEDSTVMSRSLTGQMFADVGVQQKVYSLSLGTMRNATKLALTAVLQANGQYDPVIVFPSEAAIPGLTGATEAILPLYACMSKAVSFTDAGGWGWTDDGVEFREAK